MVIAIILTVSYFIYTWFLHCRLFGHSWTASSLTRDCKCCGKRQVIKIGRVDA